MLYADVIIRKRTGFQFLTYSVPASIVPYIKEGSLVEVPLRSSKAKGIVSGLRRRPPAGVYQTKELISIKRDGQFAHWQIEQTKQLAAQLGATVAEVASYTLKEPASSTDDSSRKAIMYLCGPWKKRVEAYHRLIKKHWGKSHFLFIFARKDAGELFYDSLPEKWREQFSFCPDTTGTVRKSSGNKTKGAIGTIGDIFYPLGSRDIMVVDCPDYIGNKLQRRPYFSAKTAAISRHSYEGVQLVFGQTLPSVESLAEIHSFFNLNQRVVSHIIDHTGREPLSEETISQIKRLIDNGEKVLIVVSRKGWSGLAYCPDCREAIVCPDCQRALSLQSLNRGYCGWCRKSHQLSGCNKCGGELIRYGAGVGSISNQLAKALPSVSLAPWTSDFPGATHAQVVVATEKALSRPDLIWGTVIILPDDYLTSGRLDNSWRLGELMLQLASQTPELVVQTNLPDHPIWSALARNQMLRLLRNELAQRKSFKLPPFGEIFRVRAAGVSPHKAAQAKEIESLLQRLLPKVECRFYTGEATYLEVYVPFLLSFELRQKIALALLQSWHLDIG